ncbi:MAG: pyridoxamine 5'-phosphate oxidase family protein [Alphaproteobacteria bacterium]|nr:pyridoxamine 5'-phosphate oxidase family protein [Alphaproteobacteria bacterium]
MKLTQEQLDFIKSNGLMLLGTSGTDGQPRIIITIPTIYEPDKLVLPVIQMQSTLKNIKDNDKVMLFSLNKLSLGDLRHMKITGTAKYADTGPLLGQVKKIEDARLPDGYEVHGIIEVSINDVQDIFEED